MNYHLILHRISAILLGLALTAQWYLLFIHSSPPEKRFSFEYLRYSGSIALCLNMGLFLGTTKWGGRNRFITAVLLTPALLGAPIFLVTNFIDNGFIFWYRVVDVMDCHNQETIMRLKLPTTVRDEAQSEA